MGTQGLGGGSNAAAHVHRCGAVIEKPLREARTPSKVASAAPEVRQGRELVSLNWSFSPSARCAAGSLLRRRVLLPNE